MITNINGLIQKTTEELRKFTDIAVIGLSGGADSTLVAILCMLALEKENVYGIHMPANKNDVYSFNNDSFKFAGHLNINSIIIPMKQFIDCFNFKYKNNKKLMGNIKARLRMIILYAECEKLQLEFPDKKVRVIGTDNFSENFIGYFTKYGDGGVDINPIEFLFKSEVYQLLDYFRDRNIILEEHINRIPSAGLWDGQTDENELGFTYDDIEKAIRIKNEKLDIIMNSEIYNKIIEMHKNSEHKRMIPSNIDFLEFCY